MMSEFDQLCRRLGDQAGSAGPWLGSLLGLKRMCNVTTSLWRRLRTRMAARVSFGVKLTGPTFLARPRSGLRKALTRRAMVAPLAPAGARSGTR